MMKTNSGRKAYHRYFQGYVEVYGSGGKIGRPRLERVYVAEYYRALQSDKTWKLMKFIMPGLYLLAAASFFAALTIPLESNQSWYVIASGVAALAVYLWILSPLVTFVTGKRLLVLRDYYSTNSLRRLSLAACVVTGTVVAAHAAAVLFGGQEVVAGELTGMALLVLSAATMFAMHLLQKRTKYEQVENKTKIPPDAVKVEYLGNQ